MKQAENTTLLTFNGLHGIIAQKVEFFMTTAVRTSYYTKQFYILHGLDLLFCYKQCFYFLKKLMFDSILITFSLKGGSI
jgi:hypothetical protein